MQPSKNSPGMQRDASRFPVALYFHRISAFAASTKWVTESLVHFFCRWVDELEDFLEYFRDVLKCDCADIHKILLNRFSNFFLRPQVRQLDIFSSSLARSLSLLHAQLAPNILLALCHRCLQLLIILVICAALFIRFEQALYSLGLPQFVPADISEDSEALASGERGGCELIEEVPTSPIHLLASSAASICRLSFFCHCTGPRVACAGSVNADAQFSWGESAVLLLTCCLE
jgi:hypothetical protein